MNWTTTEGPESLWIADCEFFAKAGQPFELRDVKTPEHEKFVAMLAVEYGLTVEREGTTARFLV